MKLSVIIPVYNAAPWLHRCLSSVIGQTLRDIEIVCIDDMSTDGSGAIIEELGQEDRRLRLLKSSEKLYDCGARQLGLDAARGKYVYFMDSDDYIDPDYLEQMVKHLESSGKSSVTNASYVKEWDSPFKQQAASSDFGFIRDGEVLYPSRTVQAHFPPVVWARLFRMEYLVNNGIRWADIPIAADVAFTGLTTILDEGSYVFKGPMYHYIQHPESLMNQKGRGFLDIRSFNHFYDEIRSRGIRTDGLRLYYLGPVMIEGQEQFDLLKSFFQKVKDDIRRDSGFYVAHDLFVMEAILKCSCYEEYVKKYGKSTIAAFIRNKMS